jgi:RNase P/RNase MRP subunit p29
VTASSSAPASLPRAYREALAGEIIGAAVTVLPSTAVRRPVQGTVIDESLSMLTIRVPGRDRPVRLPKAGLQGAIVLPSGELPLRGDSLRVRPEDRTKRLLAGGPRRFR